MNRESGEQYEPESSEDVPGGLAETSTEGWSAVKDIIADPFEVVRPGDDEVVDELLRTAPDLAQEIREGKATLTPLDE